MKPIALRTKLTTHVCFLHLSENLGCSFGCESKKKSDCGLVYAKPNKLNRVLMPTYLDCYEPEGREFEPPGAPVFPLFIAFSTINASRKGIVCPFVRTAGPGRGQQKRTKRTSPFANLGSPFCPFLLLPISPPTYRGLPSVATCLGVEAGDCSSTEAARSVLGSICLMKGAGRRCATLSIFSKAIRVMFCTLCATVLHCVNHLN